ncbi:hypothetical protein GCM10023205_79810 [Yinghuangia aomiensis]|uniref:Uncharacterized protein n=1 Tax=Yinghuangia aomiensis TaxID=676205 RepID=A0ABP9ID11_9ACTN
MRPLTPPSELIRFTAACAPVTISGTAYTGPEIAPETMSLMGAPPPDAPFLPSSSELHPEATTVKATSAAPTAATRPVFLAVRRPAAPDAGAASRADALSSPMGSPRWR